VLGASSVSVSVDGPIMSQSYVKLAVDAQQSASLVCGARGWPTMTISWSRNSTSLSDVSKYIMIERVDARERFSHVSVLNISNVQQDNLGSYLCTARNEMGVNNTQFILAVRSESYLLISSRVINALISTT